MLPNDFPQTSYILVNLLAQGDRIELNILVSKPSFDLQGDLI